MEALAIATLVALFIFVASVISVEATLSVAIIEIVAGVLLGNVFGVRSAGVPWLDFLGGFGGILLTFLAGAEVNPNLLRARWKESALLGGASFLLPFLAAPAYAFWVAGWTLKASLIAGCALSTTSLAVVYAVLVETGLNETEIGRLIMAATFVTDIGTALALSLLFVQASMATALFFAVSAVVIVLAPKLLPPLFQRYGTRVIEPEIKLLFLILFGLMLLGEWGASHAVLPVFVLGLALARMFRIHRELQRKLRIVAFAMITPFFFIKGGMNVSLRAVWAQWGLTGMLLLVKIASKGVGVWPLAARFVPKAPVFTTLLMSTGLTFGTISSLYGLQAGLIDEAQFSILVTVVILSAIVPTAIAQRWFSPQLSPEDQEEILAEEEESA